MVADNTNVVTPVGADPGEDAVDPESPEPPPQATSNVARHATGNNRKSCVLKLFTRIETIDGRPLFRPMLERV